MRLFLALNLPPEQRAGAWAAAAPLREALPAGVSWVREESLHVTLRFLGEQPEELVARLDAELAPGLGRAEPPTVEITGVGAFPTMRRPRILWLGGPTNSALAELYHQVVQACARLGFEPEGRDFRPHVTIGRVRQGAAIDPGALAGAAEQVRVDARFTARTVDVMESELTRSGARYRVAAAVPIGSRG